MSLYKLGGVWWIRFTTPDHREIRESAQTPDRKQAQEYHDRRKAESWRIAKLGEAMRHSWQEAVVRWLEENEGRRGLASVLTTLRQADPYLGHLDLHQISREHLADHAERIARPRLVRTIPGTAPAEKSATG